MVSLTRRQLLIVTSSCATLTLGLPSPLAASTSFPGAVASPEPLLRDVDIHHESSRAQEILFATQSNPLLTRDGNISSWVPVSVRYAMSNQHLFVLAELRNDSDQPQVSPVLSLELLSGGMGYGLQDVYPANAWTPAGGTSFFQNGSLYSGSVAMRGWDAEVWSLNTMEYFSMEEQDPSRFRINGNTLVNETDAVIGTVVFADVVRDADGIFCGSCEGPFTGANMLPGKSVKIVGDLGSKTIGDCGFSEAGMAAAKELGHSGTFTHKYIVGQVYK